VNGVDIDAREIDADMADWWVLNSTASPADVYRVPVAREVAEDRGSFRGAGTAGERLAAEAALQRVRERLTELGRQDPSIEMQFSMPDQWSRHLFLALCRRYGMKPYRYYRQRRNTVMVRAPKRFLDQVLWPEFSELDQALQAYLHQVTLRVIRDEVFADASEAQEIPEALPPKLLVSDIRSLTGFSLHITGRFSAIRTRRAMWGLLRACDEPLGRNPETSEATAPNALKRVNLI
jgi:hypothetical protein